MFSYLSESNVTEKIPEKTQMSTRDLELYIPNSQEIAFTLKQLAKLYNSKEH